MDCDGNFILQKSVNRSLLNEGLAIPVSVSYHFHAWDSSILEHVTSKPIKILIGGEFYDYRDEISGEKIGEQYGDSVVEAHLLIISLVLRITTRRTSLSSAPTIIASSTRITLTSTARSSSSSFRTVRC